jgi:hypothetical protein
MQKFAALHLICGDNRALLLVADLPITESFDKRTLIKSYCFIDRSARSPDYSWFRAVTVDARDAEVLPLLIKYVLLS